MNARTTNPFSRATAAVSAVLTECHYASRRLVELQRVPQSAARRSR